MTKIGRRVVVIITSALCSRGPGFKSMPWYYISWHVFSISVIEGKVCISLWFMTILPWYCHRSLLQFKRYNFTTDWAQGRYGLSLRLCCCSRLSLFSQPGSCNGHSNSEFFCGRYTSGSREQEVIDAGAGCSSQHPRSMSEGGWMVRA